MRARTRGSCSLEVQTAARGMGWQRARAPDSMLALMSVIREMHLARAPCTHHVQPSVLSQALALSWLMQSMTGGADVAAAVVAAGAAFAASHLKKLSAHA